MSTSTKRDKKAEVKKDDQNVVSAVDAGRPAETTASEFDKSLAAKRKAGIFGAPPAVPVFGVKQPWEK